MTKMVWLDQGELTNHGLVRPYGDLGLGQHRLREWLVAWWHQAITWTNTDQYSDIDLRGIPHDT